MTLATVILGALLRILVRLYQWVVSPLLPARCRYLPTCSDYAHDALARHGPLRGGWLAVRRFSRCHPWSDWGYDPVPDPEPSPMAPQDQHIGRHPGRRPGLHTG